jgi:hypothetical protein
MFFSWAPEPDVSRFSPLGKRSRDLNGASGSVIDPGAKEKFASVPVGQNRSARVPLPVKINMRRRGNVLFCASAIRLK